jgi:alkylation response protein AidB-like acyl-CoA dehydrogenase
MDFRISEDQIELAAGIANMLAGRLPLEQLRAREGADVAITDAHWSALGETGVFSLTLPEPDGVGLALADAVIVFEELGHSLIPGPLVGTFLAASAHLVDGAADGQSRVGVQTQSDGHQLIEHLDALDALLVLSGLDEPASARLIAPAPATDAARRMAEPLCPLTPMWQLDVGPDGESLSALAFQLCRDGSLLTAALQIGHAAATLELAVAYAKERHQFGKPIGSFQAIKHICADMLVRAEVARNAVHAAACLADDNEVTVAEAAASGMSPERLVRRAVMGAKMLADEAAIANARAAIQVHGGMGFTWEVPLHLHLKRSRVLATTFGTPGQLSAALCALT